MNSSGPCSYGYQCYCCQPSALHAVLTSVEWHQTHRSPLQLSKRLFWAETRYAYGQAFLQHGVISDSPKNAHPFLSVCHAKTKDSMDVQPLPAKVLGLLVFIRTIGFQLQYTCQMI